MSRKNYVDVIFDALGNSALMARDRIKDPDAYDNHVYNKLEKVMKDYLQSLNPTPEELQRFTNKINSMNKVNALQPRGSAESRRRNPLSKGIASTVNSVSLPLPGKTLDEQKREVIAAHHRENPEMTAAQTKAHFRALITAEYKPPKLALVKASKSKTYPLNTTERNEIHKNWRDNLSSKGIKSEGKEVRTSDTEWEILIEEVLHKNLTSTDLESVKSQIRAYEKRLKREEKRRNRRAD